MALIEAIDDDGYLREPIEAIAESLLPEIDAQHNEILTVLHQVQRFDPVGVGARTLDECLLLQLALLPDETPGRELAKKMADGPLERLPQHRRGRPGERTAVVRWRKSKTAVHLLRSLDPRPGAQIGGCRPIPT